MTTGTYYYGTGRRKTSVARVRIYNKPGSVSVNGKPAEDIFTVEAWKNEALKPLSVVGLDSKVTVVADIKGGGVNSQAGALCHGIARALVVMDENLKKPLKVSGLLTRDSRVKERKKPGLKGARKAKQYTKR